MSAVLMPSIRNVRRAGLALALFVAALALAACDEGAATDDATEEVTSTATSPSTPRASTPLPTAPGGTATATATEPAATGTTTGGAAGDATHSVDDTKCQPIVPLVQEAFPDADLLQDGTAFDVGGGSLVGEGCRVMVLGDADELPPYSEIAQELRGLLEAGGWEEDTEYAADGPTATMSLYRQGEELAVVAAGVSPKDPGACPSDQLIAECLDGLDPSAILVQGSIVVATDVME